MKSITVVRAASSLSLVCRTRGGVGQEDTVISWQVRGGPAERELDHLTVSQIRATKSVLSISGLTELDAGLYKCVATNKNGRHQKQVMVTVKKSPTTTTTATSTTTSTTTKTPTSTISAAPVAAARRGNLRLLPFPPSSLAACPLAGYCLHGGTCSYIAWMGEMSCACAPGFQGRRCEAKATSALYSAGLRSAPPAYPYPYPY